MFNQKLCFRFALIDIPCVYRYNVNRRRLVLVSWIPKSAPLRQQLMIPPTFSKLQEKCVAIVASYQVHEKSISEIQEQLKGITDDILVKIDGVSVKS